MRARKVFVWMKTAGENEILIFSSWTHHFLTSLSSYMLAKSATCTQL